MKLLTTVSLYKISSEKPRQQMGKVAQFVGPEEYGQQAKILATNEIET